MAARYSEELQPLADEGVTVPRAGRRTKAAVAVGLGLAVAGAAAYALTPGRSERGLTKASVNGVEGKALTEDQQRRAAPLTLEGDVGKFIDESSLPAEAVPSHGLGVSLGEMAAALFDHVTLKASSLHQELTEKELIAYKYRFIASMVGMSDSNNGPHKDFVERARKHIEGAKPVMTESLADAANSRQISFTVKMQDWMLDESKDSFESRLIKVPFVEPADAAKVFPNSLPEIGLEAHVVPKNFESAEHWPKCAEVVQNPHNQGRCGSCWVFGATGALDSRLCIATHDSEKVFNGPNAALSRGVGASCAASDKDGSWDGCQGGWPHLVYDYIQKAGGLPSTNCVPYFGGTDYASHWSDAMGAPPCPTSCDSRFPESMAQDLFNPVNVAQYKLVNSPDERGIQDLRVAIFTEGPVAYALYANHNFMGYHSGVFDQDCGHQANHAVQAIGFGHDATLGKDFIQSLNSWGYDWGNKGRFNVAPCVVWHYVIPGKILGSGYPMPIPDWKK